MNFEERQMMWRRIGMYGLPTNLFSKGIQFLSLHDVMSHAAVNQYSRDTIYNHYYKCFTPFDLTIILKFVLFYSATASLSYRVCFFFVSFGVFLLGILLVKSQREERENSES